MSIDLREAQLTASEATELADLLSAQQRLTSVDVRNNESMGLQGAEALARFMEANKQALVTSVPRSLCGVTPSHSSIEVPRELHDVELRLVTAELSTHVFSEGISAGMGNSKRKVATLNRRGASAASEWQPLLWAAKENHLPIARLMLSLGADINEQQPNTTASSQYSALHIAAQKGHAEMVGFLLERGIERKLRDKHNNTALMLAEKKQNGEIVTLLGGSLEPVSRKVE